MAKHKLPKIKPAVKLTFKEPRSGYWNGGIKSGGVFEPKPQSDGTIEWGCWGLNYWFRLGFGRSWKHAASIAKNKIKRECKVPCIVEVLWD
jgi:hypothetical protein